MKKLFLLIGLVMVVSMTYAQKSKVVSAYNYLQSQQLDKAKAYIDPTITHEKTMGMAKTWFYRGNIYLALQLTQNEKFQDLRTDAIKIAHESYLKALELDVKESYKSDIMNRLLIIGEQYYNEGVKLYKADKYSEAADYFLEAKKINMSMGKVDSLATYNHGMCSERAGDSVAARSAYEELIEMGYNNPLIYTTLSKYYLDDKDTVAAYAIIDKGRVVYPSDFNLLIAETNLFLTQGNVEGAQRNLTQAIEIDNTNPTIFFAVGTTYDQIGQRDKAAEAYKSAIELNPEYFDAYYNLGALYVNQAASIMDAANELPLGDPAYDSEKEKADNMLQEAIPYLEKAVELNPTEIYTLTTLKEIYARTKQYDKLKKVNELMKAAQEE